MPKPVIILIQIIFLTVLYLIGIGIQQQFNLFIPGSVIGLLILFTLLITKTLPDWSIRQGAGFMIRHLPFFFIPATAGIMSYAYVFKGEGLLLIPIVLFSTMLVMGISGSVTQWMERRKAAHHE